MRLELHLGSSPLPAKITKAILACDGTYTHCRGSRYKRYVTVPIDQADLIERLIREFADIRNRVTVVARPDSDEPYHMHHLPAWVVVQHLDCRDETPMVEQFRRKYDRVLAEADARGLVRKE